VLALLCGLCLLLVPILFVTWDFRYTLPAVPVLGLAAVVGLGPRRPISVRATVDDM
jgi:hypothetical protein